MAGFFNKIKGASTVCLLPPAPIAHQPADKMPLIQPSGNPSTKDTAAKKKDEPLPEITPLERMLQNAGPLREDGSDRFFGFENVRRTPPPTTKRHADSLPYSLEIPGTAPISRRSCHCTDHDTATATPSCRLSSIRTCSAITSSNTRPTRPRRRRTAPTPRLMSRSDPRSARRRPLHSRASKRACPHHKS